MSTIVYPLTIRQGQDFPLSFQWSAGAPAVPVLLNGCTATMMIRQLPTDGAPLLSISTTPNAQGAILVSGSTITLNIFRAATATLPVGFTGGPTSVSGVWLSYDLDILFPANTSFPAGQLWPFARGAVYVKASYDH